MSEGITREELSAVIETTKKSTEQMVLIAGSLRDIVEEQRKLNDKMTNGLCKNITDTVNKKIDDECKPALKEIKDNTWWIKVIFGAISFITVIVIAINSFIHYLSHAK